MLESIETRFIGRQSPPFVGKLDFSLHPCLRDKIMQYKWNESVNMGYDIGLVSATIGYFVDNPDELKKPEFVYLFEVCCNSQKPFHNQCLSVLETNLIQSSLIPIALLRNKYYRSIEAGTDVGEDAAKLDFYDNRASEWFERARNALCALCIESPQCGLGQNYFKKLLQISSSTCEIYTPISEAEWMQEVHGEGDSSD